jgi:hypothetical protein
VDPPLQEWADNGGVALLKEKSFFVIMSEPSPQTSEYDLLGL